MLWFFVHNNMEKWKSSKKQERIGFIHTWRDMRGHGREGFDSSYASGNQKWFPLDLSNTTIFKFMLQIAKTQQTRLMMALHWDIFTQLSIFFIFTCVTVQLIRTPSLKPPKKQNKGYEFSFLEWKEVMRVLLLEYLRCHYNSLADHSRPALVS